MRSRLRAGLRAGAVAAVLSGIPSTVHALTTRRPLLESTRAAGTVVHPDGSPGQLVVAGIAAHLALSLGWGAVLGVLVPRRAPVTAGALAGLAIAALDLGIAGRRARIAALPLGPQVADHIAFGVVVGLVLRSSDR